MPMHAWCAVTGNRPLRSSRCNSVHAQCHAEWWGYSERWAAVNMRCISLWSITSWWQWWTAGIAAKLERRTVGCSEYPLAAFALKVKVSSWKKKKSTSLNEIFFSLRSHLHPLFWTLVASWVNICKGWWVTTAFEVGFSFSDFSQWRSACSLRLWQQWTCFLVVRWRPWDEP